MDSQTAPLDVSHVPDMQKMLYAPKFQIDVGTCPGRAVCYGQCNGQACLNALRYESDLIEDCTFDPKILRDLETNILDDENYEKELEIFEGPEGNEEEEEKLSFSCSSY
ncbi:hypothetical protein TNIN_405601 [Trichonephila inaurata madagascariensis]|uniref:Uncharacterized protein n=1 Tax=Trichonephila inaurata madagascariensis TaxID=2747483 RepID=A0A8X6XNL0_9ARAC|nr:hypothetical protein TNIN_405601 [Trichonephila inaurata madagascariensis]